MLEALSRKGIHAVDANQSAVSENALLSNAPFKLVKTFKNLKRDLVHAETQCCFAFLVSMGGQQKYALSSKQEFRSLFSFVSGMSCKHDRCVDARSSERTRHGGESGAGCAQVRGEEILPSISLTVQKMQFSGP